MSVSGCDNCFVFPLKCGGLKHDSFHSLNTISREEKKTVGTLNKLSHQQFRRIVQHLTDHLRAGNVVCCHPSFTNPPTYYQHPSILLLHPPGPVLPSMAMTCSRIWFCSSGSSTRSSSSQIEQMLGCTDSNLWISFRIAAELARCCWQFMAEAAEEEEEGEICDLQQPQSTLILQLFTSRCAGNLNHSVGARFMPAARGGTLLHAWRNSWKCCFQSSFQRKGHTAPTVR